MSSNPNDALPLYLSTTLATGSFCAQAFLAIYGLVLYKRTPKWVRSSMNRGWMIAVGFAICICLGTYAMAEVASIAQQLPPSTNSYPDLDPPQRRAPTWQDLVRAASARIVLLLSCLLLVNRWRALSRDASSFYTLVLPVYTFYPAALALAVGSFVVYVTPTDPRPLGADPSTLEISWLVTLLSTSAFSSGLIACRLITARQKVLRLVSSIQLDSGSPWLSNEFISILLNSGMLITLVGMVFLAACGAEYGVSTTREVHGSKGKKATPIAFAVWVSISALHSELNLFRRTKRIWKQNRAIIQTRVTIKEPEVPKEDDLPETIP